MITRTHIKGDAPSSAVYSDCENYRYSLTRQWDGAGKRVGFIMLNPSTATEVQNDPTIERCEQRARRLGYGGFMITNIFAWRATDPKDMRRASDPVGPDNDAALLTSIDWADDIIAAWGAHGGHMQRGVTVAGLLHKSAPNLFHLGLTKAGEPRHPLYLPYAQQPVRWVQTA